MNERHAEDFGVEIATRIVKLIRDLDEWIRSLRGCIRGKQPWERALIGLLADADRCMQILRMTEALGKPDQMIAEAAIELAGACRRMELAIRGSRADAFVRSSVQGAGRVGTSLAQLMVQACEATASFPAPEHLETGEMQRDSPSEPGECLVASRT